MDPARSSSDTVAQGQAAQSVQPAPALRHSRARRWLCRLGLLLGAIAIYCLAHVLLVTVYPNPLFRYRLNHGNFTVYMREPIPPETAAVLDRVAVLLAASDLNDAALHHDVYILNNQTLACYLFLHDVGFGCNQGRGHTFIVDADPAHDVARCRKHGPNDRRSRTLSGAIAHEITHHLLRRRFGPAEPQIPHWIVEGYCDVIADGSAIDASEGLALLTNASSKPVPGLPYFRYRLAVEYLLKAKRLSIEELVSHPPTFDAVEAEIIAGLRREGSAFLRRYGSHIAVSSAPSP